MVLSQTMVETVVVAYIQCALWSSIDDDGEPLDSFYEAWDLSDEATAAIIEEVEDFLIQLDEDEVDWSEGWSAEQFGHDFWLTRNGHGAGFWDRYSGPSNLARLGDELTKRCKAYGSSDLYVGDDGKVHVS